MVAIERQREHRFSRRLFVQGVLAAGTAVGLAQACTFAEQFRSGINWREIRRLKQSPNSAMPPEHTGISFTDPFGWDTDEPGYTEDIAQVAVDLGARSIRLFADAPNKPFEPSPGVYRDDTLEKIIAYSNAVYDASNGQTGTVVSAIDGFRLFHRQARNPVWGTECLEGPIPLPVGLKQGQRNDVYGQPEVDASIPPAQAFFQDESIREIFKNRIRHMVRTLKDTPSIIAWDLGNELSVPVLSENRAQIVLTRFYDEMIGTVREIDHDRWIFLGVAKPWDIDDQMFSHWARVGNTLHMYVTSGWDLLLHRLSKYLHDPKRALPVICQEIGMPSSFLCYEIPSDEMLSRFLRRVAEAGMYRGEDGEWYSLMGQFDLWQIGRHVGDKFNISKKTHPESWAFAQNINILFQRGMEEM